MGKEITISISGKFKRNVEHGHQKQTTRILLETEEGKCIDGLIFHSEHTMLGLDRDDMIGKHITVNMLERDKHDPALEKNIRGNPNTSKINTSLFGNDPLAVYPDEVDGKDYPEGAVISVKVNRYERNQAARKKCMEYFQQLRGCIKCEVCEMGFDEEYEGMRTGLIHVHHIKPVSEIGHEYKIDPIKDLVPVCPNCHAVIHSKEPAYSIEDVRAMLKKK